MNVSGINPTEFNVVIFPKQLEEKTAGGIIIPDQTKDRDQFAQMEGVLIAAAPHAFSYAEWSNGARPPQVGQRVMFARYAGTTWKGSDGKDYRIVKDKDILAVA